MRYSRVNKNQETYSINIQNYNEILQIIPPFACIQIDIKMLKRYSKNYSGVNFILNLPEFSSSRVAEYR